MTPGGRVTVRARVRAGKVRVLVADTGIGIAASEQTRIFETFYQIGNSARDRSLGLGLGLAIVRDLATLLGLRIRLKSRLGHGTVFVVDIPIGQDEPAALLTVQAAAPDRVVGAFVVLIDDDPMAREAMAVTLRDLGCRLLVAESEAEALRQLESAEFPPQVVLTDYRLGNGRTGLQAIAGIGKKMEDTYGADFMPIALVISGDTSPGELSKVSAAGYTMLHKPVSLDQLRRALNSGLQSRA